MSSPTVDEIPAPEKVSDGVEGESVEAPYGYRSDGVTPRKSNAGRKPKPGPLKPPPPPSARRPSKPRADKPDYRRTVGGLIQVVATPLLVVSPLDGAAVLHHSDALIDALDETAQREPRVGALLEKLGSIGPWSLLAQAVLGLGIQVAANHGWLPPQMTSKLGALPPDELMRRMGATVPPMETAGPDAGQAAPYDVPIPFPAPASA